MSLHRLAFVALATLFTAGMTSVASAGCCGSYAPAYAAPVTYAAPTVYGGGCGGCGANVAVVYAEPVPPQPIIVIPQPVAPAPIAVAGWDTGGCGCNGRGVYAAPAVQQSPLYIADQGPDYDGPGLMLPYRTYAPEAAYMPANNYPYVGYRARYHHVYRGSRFAYQRGYVRPHYWRRPLGVRG